MPALGGMGNQVLTGPTGGPQWAIGGVPGGRPTAQPVAQPVAPPRLSDSTPTQLPVQTQLNVPPAPVQARNAMQNTPFAKALAALSPEDRERTATGITPGMVSILKSLGLGNSPEEAAQLEAFGSLHLRNSIRLPGVTVTFSPRHRGLVDQVGQEKIAKTIAKLFNLENTPLDTSQSDIARPPSGGLVS